MSFVLEDVTARYPGAGEAALRGVSARFATGAHTAILGPNGAGKSTLLRVLLGLLRPERGRATLDGLPTATFTRREMARRTALVAAGEEFAFPLTVRELVGLGRNPHLAPWAGFGAEDREIVARALDDLDLRGLADRPVSRLSAGELQRVRLARALAQRTTHLLLDEPTAHLDLAHEIEIFERVSQLTGANALTVISITHNLNLASRYADRLLLLSRGRVTAEGPPADVLTGPRIEQAFGCPVRVETRPDLGVLVVPEVKAREG
ncbi:MAG: ABC transporter ATP-binding protein [Gemmatimonadota bacterium]